MDPEKKEEEEREETHKKEEEDSYRRRCAPMNPCSLKSRRKTNGSTLGMDELNSKLGVNKRTPKPQNPSN
jgi:hypothetical protein